MRRRFTWAGGMILGVGLIWIGQPGRALITRIYPLRQAMSASFTFVAKVDKLYRDKPGVMRKVGDQLKGNASFHKPPVNVTGDSDARKHQHTPHLLERLAPRLGPEVKPAREHRESKIENRESKDLTARSSILDPPSSILHPRSPTLHRGPIFAVIPTVGIFGPLAILAVLFPAVFGGLAFWMRRWLVLLSVASMDSTIYLLYAWFGGKISQHWWGSQAALWMFMSLVTLTGAVWSWRRHRAAIRDGQAELLLPRPSDAVILWGLSLVGLGIVVFCLVRATLFTSPWRELLPVWVVAWVGTLYTLFWRPQLERRPGPRTGLPAEGIMLLSLVFACVGLGATVPPRDSADAFETSGPAENASPRQRVLWRFQAKDPGLIVSSPVVVGDRVYTAALHQDLQPYGTLYCLDRATGNEIWRFDNEKDMKPAFCSPCVAVGRLYIGEGFHQDSGCKLYCLDSASGAKLWEFATTSHTESTPCVAAGKVFFGAGDDGVYCLDARTGARVWHFEGRHVDTQLAVSGQRLYGGSGYGTFEMFCLDTANGKPLWRMPSPLPVFGSPAVAGAEVFFGIGNGDFNDSAEHPAGALVCLDARTGKPRWPACQAADGVHVRPAVVRDAVYFCSRDHHCYCADRKTGRVRWKQDLGSPAVASPALAGTSVYAIGTAGRVCCLDAHSGDVRWKVEVAKLAHVEAMLRSSPAVTVSREGRTERHQIYFGAELNNLIGATAALYCLEDQVERP